MPKAKRAKSNRARSRTGAAIVRGVDTAVRAVELRAQAYTFDEIGAQLGITGEGARKAVRRGLEQTIVASKEQADELRAVETERLLWLLAKLRPAAEKGEVRAIGEARAISARLSALHGLDAPTRTQVTGANGGPIQHAVGSLADVLRVGLEGGEGDDAPAEPKPAELSEVIEVQPVPEGVALVEGDA